MTETEDNHPNDRSPSPPAELTTPSLAGEPPPGPFATTPRSVGPGVAKPLAIGCAVVLVLMLIAGVVLVLNVNTLLAKSFELIETQLTGRLPDDLPAATRARFDQAFAGARQAMEEGNFDPFAVQKAETEISKLLRSGEGELTADKLVPMLEAVEKIPNPPDSQ